MITEKLEEMVRRQSALTEKMLSGDASDDERAELERVTAAIRAATEPQEVQAKTSLRTMTLKEFQEQSDALLEGSPSKEQLSVLRRNVAAVKDQGATEPDSVIAVEVLVEMSAEDRLAKMERRIDELEKRFDKRTRTGVKPSDPPAEEAPAAEEAAEEAPEGDDTEKAKGKKPDFSKPNPFGGDDDEEMDDEEMKGKKKAKKEGEPEEGEASEEAEEKPEDGEAKKDDEDEDEDKTEKAAAWNTGDLAGPSMGAQAQFDHIKKARDKRDLSE